VLLEFQVLFMLKFFASQSENAAVIAVESPTATFQLDDFLWQIVSAAIFW
jgi:hypothetical protein